MYLVFTRMPVAVTVSDSVSVAVSLTARVTFVKRYYCPLIVDIWHSCKLTRSTICSFRWNSLNSLPTPRCHAGLAECGGKLYLVGGSTFPVESSTVCSLASILRYEELEDRCVVVDGLGL